MHTHKIFNNFTDTIYAGSSNNIVNISSSLVKSNFHRTNSDLVAITPEGKEIVFVDYFSNFELPSIVTENGLLLKGSVLKALAGPLFPGKYVQAASNEVLSIGEVSSITGTVKATRLDGSTSNLNTGDPVFQGDTIETVGSGTVGLVFLDKTTLSLSEGGKMVLDELVYDPATGTGSMAVDMVEGAFSFVSGEIAKTGPDAMQIETPVVTMGIRGTTVAGKAAVEGNENSFTLLQDADGGVGQISVSNDGGTQVLSQVGATTTVSSFTAPPPPPIILTPAQIQANYGTALNVLPPTPVVAPTPQAAPPPQEQQQQEQQVQEEAQEESSGEEGTSEEAVSEEGEDGPPEGEEGLEGEGPPEGEEGLGEEGPSVSEEAPGSDEQSVAQEAFDTALADGVSPEQAMAEAAATAGQEGQLPGDLGETPSEIPSDGPENNPLGNTGIPNLSSTFTNNPTVVIPGMMQTDSTIGNIGIPNMDIAYGPNLVDIFAGPIIGPTFGSTMGKVPGFNLNESGLNLYTDTSEPVIDFFEDPSLYDDYQQNQQQSNQSLETFLINGNSDFGKTLSNFSNQDTLTINFSFDEPSSTYSVVRSNFYEYDSASQNLIWDSKPSSSLQTIAETEPNGNFSNAQVINRSSFKGGNNSDVADGTLHWTKITGGWINNGVDLFKVDLQQGETLIVDIDYGDAYGDSINTYVTLYNSSQ